MDSTSAPMNCRHLRRWNTISTSDLELLPLNPASHSYRSLKDLLPSLGAVNSPKLTTRPSGSEIGIRNRLVKQAARAYLSPMSAYPISADGNFLHRLWAGVAAVIDFFCTKLFRFLDGAPRAVRIRI